MEVSYEGSGEAGTSSVVIMSEGGVRLEVPVLAEAPCARLALQGDAAAGVVRLGKEVRVAMRVVNEGQLPGSFAAMLPAGSALLVEPAEGAVAAGGAQDLEVSFTPSEAGVFEEVLALEWGGTDGVDDMAEAQDDDAARPRGASVQVTAEVVSQSFELLRGGGEPGALARTPAPLAETDFGPVYFGEAATSSATVLNNGPEAVVFRVAAVAGTKAAPDGVDEIGSAPSTDADPSSFVPSADPLKEGAFAVFPREGVIPPYGSATLALTFAPTKTAPSKGFHCQEREDQSEEYVYTAFVSFAGHERRLRLPVRGSGEMAALDVRPAGLLRFGDVAVHDAVDRVVSLVNTNGVLPCRFAIGRSATFKASPASGDLEPGASAEVTLSYGPRTLGTHREALPVRVLSTGSGRTMGAAKIAMTGVCTAISSRCPIVGGPNTLPTDFARKQTFVGDEGAASLRQPYTRRKPWEEKETSAIFSSPADMQLSAEEIRDKEAHSARYTSFIRRHQTQRRARASGLRGNGKFETDPVSLGMRSASGLRAPEPELPKADDPIWQATNAAAAEASESTAAGGVVKPRNRPAYMEDEALHSKSRFKARPSTLQEQRECSLMLVPQDIMRVATGPSLIDFGRITCLSMPVKTFAVTNELSQTLLVEVNAQEIEDLASSTPASQVVPAGVTAGFDVALTCANLGSLHRTVEYVINGKHRYAFEVTAEIVPVTVNLSTESLNFGFDAENFENFVTEYVKIANPNTHPVEFSVSSSSGAFVASPSSGVINAGLSAELAVTWTPASGSSGGSDAELSLRVVGGAARRIACAGISPEGKLTFREKSVNFGSVCVGEETTRTATVRNVGASDAVFTLDQAPPWVRCTPGRARLSPGSSADLQLVFTGEAPQVYASTLQMAVRGSKPIKLNLSGEAIVPQAAASPDAFDFGDVYLGGTARRTLTLTNTSPIRASLELDLIDYPSFYIESPRELWANLAYEENPVRVLRAKPDTAGAASSSGVPGTASMPLGRTVSTASSVGGASCVSGETGLPVGGKYRISVNANSSLDVHLVFRPSAVYAFDFNLPLVLGNVTSELATGLTKLSPRVKAYGLRPRLLLSTAVVDFGSRIVRSERVKKIPYTMDVEVTNNDEGKELSFEFGQPVAADGTRVGAYTIEPQSGRLAPGQACVLRVSYMPHAKRDDLATAPIFLDGDDSKAYVSLELAGSGRYPKLLFDRREVTLQPVPLGMTATARFTVRNDGYDNLELKCKLPADTQRAPLEISFPNGRMIGIAKEALEVEVAFASRKPLSFTANVDFLDDDGNRFSIPVSGATDNCLLTLYPFMGINAGKFELQAKAHKPVGLVDSGGCVCDAAAIEQAAASESSSLARLLNASTMKGPFSKDLSQDMLASRGRVMIEVIEFLSAKQVFKVGKLSSNRREQIEQLMEQHAKMLNFLKSHGALLNVVKPEFLLELEDFRGWVANKMQRVADGFSAGEDGDTPESVALLQQTEARFGLVSKVSWTAVVMQTVRVFLLSRVTLRSFKMLPGTDPAHGGADSGAGAETDGALAGSNCYTVSESILLRWLTLHFQKILPSVACAINNFDKDLRDGMALYAVMVSHWPSLESFYISLRKPCRTEAHFRDNARVVVSMVRELALPYTLHEDDILLPKGHEMVLFILHLYQSLPQLIPRSALEFTGRLGEPVTKTIELTNPSGKAISYSVKVNGHSHFAIDATAVRIEPRATVAFPVTCTPHVSKPAEARLVFNSRRDGTVHAATLVFALKSNVQSREPVRTHHVQSRLYEFQQFELTVANPFPHDGEFTVTLLQRTDPGAEQVAAAAKGASGGGVGGGGGKGKGKGKGGGAKSKGGQRARAVEAALEAAAHFPEPFGISRTKLRIKQGESATVQMAYLPFTLGTHTATVLFEEAKFGEFVYEVTGEAEMPAPFGAPLKFMCDAKGACTKDVAMTPPNPALEAAKKLWLEKHPGAASKAQHALVKAAGSYHAKGEVAYQCTTNSPHVACAPEMRMLQTSGSFKHANPTSPIKKPQGASLEATSPTGAGGVPGAANAAVAATDEGEDGGALPNVVLLTLHPKSPGTYPTRVTLVSAYDVRVLDVEFTAQSSGTRAKLEFGAPARRRIVQEIPLVNSGEKPLQVSATLHSGGGVFSGPRDLSVPPGATAVYPLAFRGPWIGEYTGELKLDIQGTSETNVYTLSAVTEEPLSQGHVVIECAARQRATATVHVPCITDGKDIKYQVHSDLRDAVGPSTHTVRAVTGERGSAFTFEVIPQTSGVERGSLTFTASNGMYVWYTVELRIAAPPFEREVSVSTGVRKAAAVAITMTNPLDRAVEFAVLLEGESLLGEPTLRLGPSETSSYQLVYSPLTIGKQMGSVRFVSPEIGEFWYRLNLEATQDAAVEVSRLSAVVGRTVRHALRVENPTGQPALLSAHSSNPRNFYIADGGGVEMPPFGAVDVELVYSPSSVGATEHAEVTLSADGAGEWAFTCSGEGLPPGLMPPERVSAPIGQSNSTVVAFTNPFPEPISVSVRVSGGGDGGGGDGGVEGVFFSLLKKDAGVAVGAFQTLQIPVRFTPARMQAHAGECVVRIDGPDAPGGGADAPPQTMQFAREGDAWTFPIEGIAEAPGDAVFKLRCRARQACEETLEVNLTGLPAAAEGEAFTHELLFPEESAGALSEQTLSMEALDSSLSCSRPLRFKARFAPQRVLSTSCDFVIAKASGGRWRFEVQLEASEPELDGIISIEALVAHTETAYFKLASPSAKPCKFTAAFTADSPLEFSIAPATGVMPAAGVDPSTGEPRSTAFAVSFTPKEYGAMAVGRVVIQTAEVEWLFEVRGARPQYVPPVRGPKVDTTLSLDLREHMAARHLMSTRRNFLKENLSRFGNRRRG